MPIVIIGIEKSNKTTGLILGAHIDCGRTIHDLWGNRNASPVNGVHHRFAAVSHLNNIPAIPQSEWPGRERFTRIWARAINRRGGGGRNITSSQTIIGMRKDINAIPVSISGVICGEHGVAIEAVVNHDA